MAAKLNREQKQSLAKTKRRIVRTRKQATRKQRRVEKLKTRITKAKRGKDTKREDRVVTALQKTKRQTARAGQRKESLLETLRKDFRRGRTVTERDPGKKSPVIEPFLTGEDLERQGEAQSDLEGTLFDVDKDLADRGVQTTFEQGQIEGGRKAARSSAQFDFAARGLQQSSLRDAELFDIDATAGIRRAFLGDQLATATLRAQTQKDAATNAFTRFQQAQNRRAVENAQEANTGLPVFIRKPSVTKTKLQLPPWVRQGRFGPGPQGRVRPRG